MKRWTILFLAIAAPALAAERPAKNVILFLADAGGLPTLNAASIHGYGQPQKLFIQSMPHVGLSDTSTASAWVSDSAAGMTAIVTGYKTHNGVLSQSDAAVRGKKDGEPLKTILEHAEERGLSTGVLTNRPVFDATPAACYAQANDRKMTGEILAQFLKPRFGDGVDVLIGAGRKQGLAATEALGLNWLAEAGKRGYQVLDSADSLRPDARRVVALLESGKFDLASALEKTIQILSRNPKGFFLMVEWDAHTDKLLEGLNNAVELDRAIRTTAQRMKTADTLILFTADHSFDLRVRGGRRGEPLVAAPAGDGSASPAAGPVKVDGGHTGEEVVAAAQGPGAQRVRGFLANTDLFHIMMAAYGWNRR